MADHGCYSTYNGGCRCDECRQAAADYRRTLRYRHAGITPSAPCWFCSRLFANEIGRGTHQALVHD